ncbi:MAG: BCCT family transporter [Pseudomonadales bacterium]|nr:BCCT family transporter [Pseudomonadales bacterium]
MQAEEPGRGGKAEFSSDPLIFFTVLGFVTLVIFAAWTDLPDLRAFLLALQDGIAEGFSWFFSLTVSLLLAFAIWLIFSRHAHVKLGADDSQPDFSLLSWLSMLFSAGMGIGLVFFGVAEPVLHFLHPPAAEPMSLAAARDAIQLSVFHWGLHAWAIYAVLGASLAYFHHRGKEPLAIRSTLRPLLKSHTHRLPGKFVDILAVIGTLFGLATSLGLGAIQINAGLSSLYGFSQSALTQALIIVLITFCATTSLVTGLDKGIRRLSELNMLLAAALLAFVLLAGPSVELLRGLPEHLGNYLQSVVGLGLRTNVFGSIEWQKAWTIFYWAWWLSWAPFVATFIARISRGRTIREFVLGVLLAPTLVALLWFGVFGGAALDIEMAELAATNTGAGIGAAVEADSATAIFVLLDHFPFPNLTAMLAIFLITVFFISSSDSGSFVVDMLTSGGNPNPPVWQRIFWASLEGLLAIVLLLIGGLNALQAGAISLGLPFCFLLLLVMVAFVKELNESAAVTPAKGGRQRQP